MSGRPAISSTSGMLSHLPVLVEVYNRRSSDPPHWHDYTQIWYVLRGSFRHSVDGVEYVQHEGECSVILPYTLHSVDSRDSSEDTCVLSISYADKFLTDRSYDIFSYSKLRARFEGFSIPANEKLTGARKTIADSLANAMIEEFSKHRAMSFDLIAEHLAAFLRNLCTEPAGSSHGLDAVAERAAAITETLQFIAQNLSLKHSLDSLCRRACMSRSAFTHNFKAVTGMTSKEFLLSERLQRTYALLVFSDKTVDEIAREVGFYDSAYLNNTFREKYGEPPVQYRLNHRSHALSEDAIFRKRWEWFFESESDEIGKGKPPHSSFYK